MTWRTFHLQADEDGRRRAYLGDRPLQLGDRLEVELVDGATLIAEWAPEIWAAVQIPLPGGQAVLRLPPQARLRWATDTDTDTDKETP